MRCIRSLLLLCTVFFSFSTPTWACNSYQLNQIKQDVIHKKQLLNLRNYNYNFLSQMQHEILSEKSILNTCLISQYKIIANIKSTLHNPNMSSIEQQNILNIQKNSQDNLDLIRYNLEQINQLMIIIHDKLNYAKDYTDERNRMKSFVQLIQVGHFVIPSLKSIENVFPVIYDSISNNLNLFILAFCGLFFLSFITLFAIKKYTQKSGSSIKKSFYLHTRYTFLIIFPLVGLFLVAHDQTNSWLILPAGFILVRWGVIMCLIQICSTFYLSFLSNNISEEKFVQLYRINQKIIYSLCFVGISQFLTLNFFENGDIIDLMYLIFTIPVFFYFYTYYMIQLILALTTTEYFPSVSTIKLHAYRYLGITFILIYMIIRQGSVYFGYQLFSTAQFTCTLIIFIYFFRYLQFIKNLKSNLNPHLKQGWVKLKSYFGIKSNENLIEINVLIGIFNLMLFYYIVLFALYILTIPDYYIFLIKNLINYPIVLSTLDFSPINIIKAVLAFTITVLVGKFIASRITQNPQYAHDIDKRLTINIVIHYSFYILAILISLLFIGLSAAHISVIIGSIGVGLGIGAQYIVHNMISGLIIITKKMVHVGDFISIININKGRDITSGKIEKISILSTQILDEDQLLINVPNSYILENCVVNFTSSEDVNTCYINLKIKNIHDYHDIVHQIIELLNSYADVIQTFPYGPSVKLLQSKTEGDREYRNINISFSVSNLSEKQFLYSQIKTRILKELKDEIFIDNN